MEIHINNQIDAPKWDAYIRQHRDGNHCHLYSWKTVMEKAYHLSGYYLQATTDENICGILPLIHIKSRLFGNQLVSMPFLSYGGILADSIEIANQLHAKAVEISKELNADALDYRYMHGGANSSLIKQQGFTQLEKVRMILELPETSELLMSSFKAKLRSQIRRPVKEGMRCHLGGIELTNDFYQVFAENMRDLGSPVHSIDFFKNILESFVEQSRIGVVYQKDRPVAAGLIVKYKDTVEIPWASSLKQYNRFSPNMLLYWSFLDYACNNRLRFFDFGRSTKDEGTFRFKQQWGAQPEPLNWIYAPINNQSHLINTTSSASRQRQIMVNLWRRLPLKIANYLGPRIRYKISL